MLAEEFCGDESHLRSARGRARASYSFQAPAGRFAICMEMSVFLAPSRHDLLKQNEECSADSASSLDGPDIVQRYEDARGEDCDAWLPSLQPTVRTRVWAHLFQ